MLSLLCAGDDLCGSEGAGVPQVGLCFGIRDANDEMPPGCSRQFDHALDGHVAVAAEHLADVRTTRSDLLRERLAGHARTLSALLQRHCELEFGGFHPVG